MQSFYTDIYILQTLQSKVTSIDLDKVKCRSTFQNRISDVY